MIEIIQKLCKRYNITLDDVWNGILYLRKYGYLDSADETVDEKTFKGAVKTFQQFFQLKQDGLLGPKSLHAMQAPRCSVPDNMAAVATRWHKKEVRYYIDGYVSGLSRGTQASLIRQAWESWGQYIDIKFIRTNNRSKTNIYIGVGYGDKFGFDGAGGILAWAQYPSSNRKIYCRMDGDETWITNPSQRGILYLNVIMHEIGHLVGLSHSNVAGALMAPTYNPMIDRPQVSDDVIRIQALYEDAAKEPEPEPKPKSNKKIITIEVEGEVKDVKVRDG